MMRNLRFTRRNDLLAGLALAILPALFYPLAASRRGVFYVGDIFRLYYPQRAVYAEALRAGHLPLWTPNVLAGYPLLAEGQTGMLYPLNLLLYRFLPIDVALNYSILLALSLAGVATYVLARVLRLRPAAAVLAALTLTYGGFFVGHFNHLNIMGAAPWLPLELAIVERVLGARRSAKRALGALVIALGLVIGVQFLAGHPQIWLMSTLVVLAFGLFRAAWPATGPRRPPAQAARLFAPVAISVLVGLAVAAIQLLPTWELVQQSVRAGGLPADFFTSFSWHPALLTTLLVPFILGNPYPNISVELAAYLGILPLSLAFAALALRRNRLTAFLVGLAGVALVLAFGDYTPLYAPLSQVPVLNLFRVPARFLYVFSLAVALLAGLGLDALLSRYSETRPRTSRSAGPLPPSPPPPSLGEGGATLPFSASPPEWGGIAGGPEEAGGEGLRCGPSPLTNSTMLLIAGTVVAGAIAIRAASLDALLALRWVLPATTLVLTAGLLALAWRQRIGRHTFAWAAIGLTVVDLCAFGAVYRQTYNDLMPVATFYEQPASLSFFPGDTRDYRVLTHQAIVPALSVMRASLYPDISLLHGIPSANGYFPLTPTRHARYLADLTPGRLNLLNARYFAIPQLLPADPETERYDLHDPFVPDPVGNTLAIPPTRAESVELISFTSQSADWPQGEVVAEIVLRGEDGSTVVLPVRAGQETAEWAYDRPDVLKDIAHQQPSIAQTWPARSGFPPEEHAGQAYRARYALPQPMRVSSVQIIPKRPAGLIHIAEMTLVEHDRRHGLAELLGLGHHQLVYRDPDVAIYDNLDALPRAFVVYQAQVVADNETALSIIDDPNFDPRREVLLANSAAEVGKWGAGELGRKSKTFNEAQAFAPLHPGAPAPRLEYSPRRVEIQAELDQPGYLVLLDSYYPGWRASVDGRPEPVWRADVLFRAVALERGRHSITFAYDPLTFKIGSAVSLVALAGLAIAAAWLLLRWRSAAAIQMK
ncbi:MAG: YfhO family protein [Anaerolineae bacterium]